MPTPPLLNLDALVAPIPGADPAGGSPSQTRGELKRLRDAAIEEGAALDWTDRTRQAKWQEVAKFGQKVLETGSKSLDMAARVTEALTRAHGFAGARDGFALLRRLTDEAWDRVYPKIDLREADEEPDPYDQAVRRKELMGDAMDGRANQYNWLDDPGGGAYFPHALREVVFASADGKGISVAATTQPAGNPAVSFDDVTFVARTVGPAVLTEVVADLTAARDELDALRKVVEDKFTSARATDDDYGYADRSPSFREIGNALNDCLRLVEEMVTQAGGGGAAPVEQPAAPSDSPPGTGGVASVPAVPGKPTRTDLYRQLHQIADQLEAIEPHSPVPLLVRRAVEMQGLAFPELVRQLNQEERVLAFIERSLSASASKNED